MPSHHFDPPTGRIEPLAVDSEALRGNLLGDPATRTVAVYLPEDYDRSNREYPLLVGLAGFTGSGLKLLSWRSFGESVPQRIDRLVRQGKMGQVIAVFPDCFTSLGGNQYIDSVATGNWEQFLLGEMIPAVERSFRVRRGAGCRAVFGKSSGGYGALVQGLRHGDQWAGVACHSGDIGFDLMYRGEFARALDVLASYDGDVTRFIGHLRAADKIRGNEMYALMILAMGATYDPDPDAPFGIRLPVDPHTCELNDERWRRWLEHDPLTIVGQADCLDRLRRLRMLFLDCGSRDTYHLHYGARTFVKRLSDQGVAHRYEEFDDDHSGIDYRLDVSLPLLYDAFSE